MRRRGTLAGLALAAVLAVATTPALADDLPEVDSGERPGPPLLYDDAPEPPLLEDSGPFQADPLLVSGTDAYRDGEYVYQDFLFDDRGPNTVAGRGSRTNDGQNFSPTAGDAFYPDDDRYANNAADLVELRATRDDGDLVYRVTLNTIVEDEEDAAVVGIGVDTDTDDDEPAVEWPDNAGMSSPGLDHFVTATADGARITEYPEEDGEDPEVTELDGAVEVDDESNQMTIRVPSEEVPAPGDDEEWAYVAGTGVNDPEAEAPGAFDTLEPGLQRDNEPTTGGATAGSNVFNLAFRFTEPTRDMPFEEPEPGEDPFPPIPLPGDVYDTAPGVGNWFEDEQARKLMEGSTESDPQDVPADGQSGDDPEDAAAVVDFEDIEGTEDLHEPSGCEQADENDEGCEQARILPTRLDEEDLFEGVDYEGIPHYGGALQPYLLTVPPGYEEEDPEPTGLTFSLHSLGGGYTQYKVFSPNQLREFGDGRDDLVATPLARGPDGWYTDEAEVDFFEVWADVARNFELDSERVALTGYSMGGYGTYKLGVEWPDLFGRAFTTVGPPARGSWEPPPEEVGQYPRPSSDEDGAPPSQDTNSHPRLENLRWIAFMNWVAEEDQLVPYPGPRRQQARFELEGLRSTLWTFQGDHFTLAVRDEWEEAADFLGDAEVTRDPSRVDYAFLPAADREELDLRKDHAYWVSGLRVADGSPGAGRQFAIGCPGTEDQMTCPARGKVRARSLAFGEGDPDLEPADPAQGPGASPGPAVVEGQEWDGLESVPRENALALDLDNVGEAVIDGRRARLDGDDRLRVRFESDGGGLVRLELPLPDDVQARRVGSDSSAQEVDLDSDGATFGLTGGTQEFVIGRFGNGDDGGGNGGNGNGGGGNGAGDGADVALPAPLAAFASAGCTVYGQNFGGLANAAVLQRCVAAVAAAVGRGLTPQAACAEQRMSGRRRRGERRSDLRACKLAVADVRARLSLVGL